MELGCGNFFVFKNIGQHQKQELLPIQERFTYPEKYEYDFFQGLKIVDYHLPQVFFKGKRQQVDVVYLRGESENEKNSSLEDYNMFTSFVNTNTGEIYQLANLPSFALREPGSWVEDRYYLENVEVAMPDFVDDGMYYVFLGMGNNVRTRSILLGTVQVSQSHN
jgi:hypothetical protein